MSGMVNMAVRLPSSMKDRLASLAEETLREQDQLIEQAVGRFLEREERQLDLIRQAIDGAEKHPECLVDDEFVEAWVDSLGTENELPPPHLNT